MTVTIAEPVRKAVADASVSAPRAPELTVVIPTFNERENIVQLVEQLDGALNGMGKQCSSTTIPPMGLPRSSVSVAGVTHGYAAFCAWVVVVFPARASRVCLRVMRLSLQ